VTTYAFKPPGQLANGLQVLLAAVGGLSLVVDAWVSSMRTGDVRTPHPTSRPDSSGVVLTGTALPHRADPGTCRGRSSSSGDRQHQATANLWARGYAGLKTRPGWAAAAGGSSRSRTSRCRRGNARARPSVDTGRNPASRGAGSAGGGPPGSRAPSCPWSGRSGRWYRRVRHGSPIVRTVVTQFGFTAAAHAVAPHSVAGCCRLGGGASCLVVRLSIGAARVQPRRCRWSRRPAPTR
jgi:hypothetical protein